MPIIHAMTKLRGKAYSKWLKRHQKRKADIVAMHKNGIPQAEIAVRIGVSRQRIHQIINGL